MGVGSFPNLRNPILGGGSIINQQTMDWQNLLDAFRGGAAGVGTDIFSNLMNMQLQAARSPIGLLDRLSLAGEVGSTLPVSQASQEQIGRYTSRPQNNLMADLQRWLGMFSRNMLTSEQKVQEGFDPRTGIKLTPKQRDFIRADARNRGIEPGQFADEPRRLARGGSLVIDPNRAVSSGTAVAGPASVVDRTGRTVALAGEAGQREALTVAPGASSGGVGAVTAGGQGEAPGQAVPGDEQLRRDEQFRFDEITRVRPDLSFTQRMNIARFPGGFEQLGGIQTEPTVEAARRLGTAASGDTRFRDPLVKSLALGRAPTGANISMQELSNMSPDMLNMLVATVGSNPEDLQQFLFSLQQFSPQGRRTRIAGPVAA